MICAGCAPVPRASTITFFPWFVVMNQLAVRTLLETFRRMDVADTSETTEIGLHCTVAHARTHTVPSPLLSKLGWELTSVVQNCGVVVELSDRKSTRLNSSHANIS